MYLREDEQMLMVDVGMKTYKWEGKKPTESSRDLNKITKPHARLPGGIQSQVHRGKRQGKKPQSQHDCNMKNIDNNYTSSAEDPLLILFNLGHLCF